MKNKQMNRTGNIQKKKEKWRSKNKNHTAPKNSMDKMGKKAKTVNSGKYFSRLIILRQKR